jgi:hypothetical protein
VRLAHALPALGLTVGCAQACAQNLHYVEPGLASCAAPAAAVAAAARPVALGAAVSGRIHVACGFEQGSYTVTVNATDAVATISPKTFLVNFGRVVGNGRFTVKFSTPGTHGVTAAITSNMGSPALRGRFVSRDNEFEVVATR